MLHAHPPKACWCGVTHTPGQVFDLNVHGREFPPDPADGITDPDPLLTAVRQTFEQRGVPQLSPHFGGYCLRTVPGMGRNVVRVWHVSTGIRPGGPDQATDREVESFYAEILRDAGFTAEQNAGQFGVLVAGWSA
jgi:hypothetical protein